MAKTRKIVSFVVCIGAVGVLLSCGRTYTGIYWIPKEPPIDLPQLDQEVYEAIRDLGFERARDYISKRPEMLPADGRRIEGDQASVIVAVRGGPLSITVRDFSNRRETEFTRELTRRIEQRLGEKYGLTNLKFQWQPEIVPNS